MCISSDYSLVHLKKSTCILRHYKSFSIPFFNILSVKESESPDLHFLLSGFYRLLIEAIQHVPLSPVFPANEQLGPEAWSDSDLTPLARPKQ